MNEETEQLAIETEQLISLVWEKLESWLTGLAEMLPNIVVAVLIVLVAGLLARLFSKLVRRTLDRTSANTQVVSLFSVLTRLAVLGLGLFIALGVLQLEKTVTSLLAGIGVVGLALGFAFQDIAANFMSGVIMAIREPFHLGDLVETHDVLGHVERVTLRATVIRNFSGQLVLIPNKDVIQNPIVNYTQTGSRRVEIPVGVAYGTDLESAAELASEAVAALPRDETQPVTAIYTGFGDSAIDLSVRFWIDLEDDDADYLDARSRAIVAIKKAFDESRISIPFPIRSLDLQDDTAERLASALAGAEPDGSAADAAE